MLSPAEADAHLELLGLIAKGWRPLMAHPLAVFRPRCPGCRHVLGVSVWVDCVRVFRCNWCNVAWKECL